MTPRVTIGQPLTFTDADGTMLPMVHKEIIPSGDEIKAQFSKRFHQALDKVPECPAKRGRVAWVAREFKVTPQGALKWLNGEAIPYQTKLAIIAKRIGADPAWLHAGMIQSRFSATADELALELSGVWDLLSTDDKQKILSYAQLAAPPLPDKK